MLQANFKKSMPVAAIRVASFILSAETFDFQIAVCLS